MIIHVDMDSFYVSVERLLDPSLNGKPVAVGGSPDGRGVVASASYEARAFGVRSAMPMGQAIRLCPQLVVVSSPYSSYATYSKQIHSLLLEFTPLVQMASQDEAYLDVSGTERLWGSPLHAAHQIHKRIITEIRLPCSVGVGRNKIVSKISSGLAKPNGLLYIPLGSEENFLAPLPVKRMPGIGRKTQERLEEVGIRKLGEIASMGRERLTRLFGEQGEEFSRRARGDMDSIIVVDEPAKSISAEETFAADTLDQSFLHSILSSLCEKVAYRTRRSGCRASTITLKYRYNNFETHTASRTLTSPTDDETVMLQTTSELLESRRHRGRPIRLLGVAAGNLWYDEIQLDLLETSADEKLRRLHEAVDKARSKHGYGAIGRASSAESPSERNEKRWG